MMTLPKGSGGLPESGRQEVPLALTRQSRWGPGKHTYALTIRFLKVLHRSYCQLVLHLV